MLRRAMKAKHAGFTLIELMFTVIVLAVLLGIGVPNFRDFIRNSRMASAANDLLADTNLARSEAVKRRVQVVLCKATATGTSCDSTLTTPFRRWIVFVDDGATAGAYDAGELVIKDSSVSATLSAPAAGYRLMYQSSGFPAVDGANRLTRVLFCDARGSAISVGGVSAARGILISATGRGSVTRDKTVIETAVASGGFGGCP